MEQINIDNIELKKEDKPEEKEPVAVEVSNSTIEEPVQEAEKPKRGRKPKKKEDEE